MSESRAIAQLQDQRLAVTQATLAEPGYDLASLTEEQFKGGLQRLVLVQERLAMIIATALKEGVHYGNPKDKNGKEAFPRKILYKSGSQELRRIMRLSCRITEKTITEGEGYVAVIVEVVALDGMGRVAGRASGACTSVEKRFRSRYGDGWTYRDPREVVHDCLAMAEKRAGVAATLEAAGATGFFATEESLTAVLAEGEGELAEQDPDWSSEEKQAAMLLAKKVGMKTSEELKEWIKGYLEDDHRTMPRSSEVKDLMDALGAWRAPKAVPTEVHTTAKAAPAPAPAPAAVESFADIPEALRNEGDAERDF